MHGRVSSPVRRHCSSGRQRRSPARQHCSPSLTTPRPGPADSPTHPQLGNLLLLSRSPKSNIINLDGEKGTLTDVITVQVIVTSGEKTRDHHPGLVFLKSHEDDFDYVIVESKKKTFESLHSGLTFPTGEVLASRVSSSDLVNHCQI